jgi:hypothetical protein
MTFFSIIQIIFIITLIIKYFVVIESKLPVEDKGNNLLNHPLSTTKNIDIQKRIFDVPANKMLNFDIKGTFILAVTITSFIFALTSIQSGNNQSGLTNILISSSSLS